jgi:hypothetical protein
MEFRKIQEAVRAVPFRPFSLYLTDGRSFRVPHPEVIAIGPRSVGLHTEDGSFEIISLRHITTLNRHDDSEGDAA